MRELDTPMSFDNDGPITAVGLITESLKSTLKLTIKIVLLKFLIF